MKRGGSTYIYRKDAQGNIIALLDGSGNVVVQYVYDAWGNHAVLDANGADITDVDHIGNLNPFRYRGYYYDTETGLYFLKTRYYDPETGRFITIDDISYIDPETINGLNLYAYCGNNPVMRTDENGNAWWEWLLGALLVIVVTAAVVVTAGAAAAAIGTAIGVGTALVNATMVGAAIGGLVAGGVELVSQGITNNWQSVNFGSLAIEAFTGSLSGAAAGMMGASTSVGVRLAARGAQVAISGINAALHGINEGKSFADTMASVGIAIASGIAFQAVFGAIDAKTGEWTASILESYALDGALFVLKDKLLIAGAAFLKNIFGNRKDWFRHFFS